MSDHPQDTSKKDAEEIVHWFMWRMRDGTFRVSFIVVLIVLLVYAYLYPIYLIGIVAVFFAVLCFKFRKDKRERIWRWKKKS